MKKIACYNVYNEAEHLEESLKSIRDKVDLIVVVDGAYEKFPHKFPFSTDGTLAIAKKYADKVIESSKAWKNEIFKRNQYLIGKPGDLYLIIDGHEIWSGDLKEDLGNHRIEMMMKDGRHEFFRMFVHEPGMEYQKRHYNVCINGKSLGTEFSVYPHGHLTHLETKDIIRLEAKKKFFSLPNFDN